MITLNYVWQLVSILTVTASLNTSHKCFLNGNRPLFCRLCDSIITWAKNNDPVAELERGQWLGLRGVIPHGHFQSTTSPCLTSTMPRSIVSPTCLVWSGFLWLLIGANQNIETKTYKALSVTPYKYTINHKLLALSAVNNVFSRRTWCLLPRSSPR